MSTKTAQTSLTNPAQIAVAAGAHSSSWLRVGGGHWTGTVRLTEEESVTVEQMASSWRAFRDVNGATKTVEARSLEQLVAKLCKNR